MSPVYGDPNPGWWSSWASAASTTLDYTNVTSTVPMQVYPAMVALPTEPEPERDDSPLGWLREQVAEVCELARAA